MLTLCGDARERAAAGPNLPAEAWFTNPSDRGWFFNPLPGSWCSSLGSH
jgi:hypothetical protein